MSKVELSLQTGLSESRVKANTVCPMMMLPSKFAATSQTIPEQNKGIKQVKTYNEKKKGRKVTATGKKHCLSGRV